MRRFLGISIIGKIEAHLWQNGGWTGDEKYKNLKWFGNLGYHLFCIGLKVAGIKMEDLIKAD